MQGLQPALRLALAALLMGSPLQATALRHSKHIPWQAVRALVGGRSRTFAAPASASPAAESPAVASPSAAPEAAPPVVSSLLPNAPSPSPALDSPLLPKSSTASLTAQAPAAADSSPPPAGAKSPCPCPPSPAPSGNVSTNQDFVDVARENAVGSIKDGSVDAVKNSEYAIEHAGRKNLRGVQEHNRQAIDESGKQLATGADSASQNIVGDMRNVTATGKMQMNYDALKTRQATSEHLDAAARKTTAYYIHMATTGLEPLKEKMKKNGEEMTRELHNTIAVGANAERAVDKLAADAEVKANYSAVLWENTQKEVKEAQIDANVTEDQVRTSQIGTKFSTQAVEHAKEESRKAFDMATQANLTGNMILQKVWKTKAGIIDVTREVNDALKKASKANIDAHQADMVATKMNKDALR